MIVDVHTHPPDDRAQWPEFLGAFSFFGIDYVVTSYLHPRWPQFPTPEEIREANAHARDFATFAKGRVLWLAYLNPHNDNWVEELDTCIAEGARGVKLWVSVKDADGRHIERALDVVRAAGKKNLPVLIHSCNRTEREFPGEADTAEVTDLAREAPETIIIEGHAGSNWRKGLGLREGLDNLYVDFSAYFPEKDKVARIIEDSGVDRVLFGSDCGIRDLGSQLAKVYFSGLDREVMEKILWKNAARVFNIPAPSRPSRIAVPTVPPSVGSPLPDKTEDHFCFCGRWPTLHFPHTAAELQDELKRCGILKAFTASADSLYSDDLIAANAAFRELCESVRPLSRIVPLATLDPAMPNWPAQLRHAQGAFSGGFVSPYLHNWRLDDPAHADLFSRCADLHFPLWINCAVGDHRWRHRASCPRPVAKEEVLAFLDAAPGNAYVFQGVGKDPILEFLGRDSPRGDARFELSRLTDFPGHLAEVMETHGADALVFGAEYPLRELAATRWAAAKAWEFANLPRVQGRLI